VNATLPLAGLHVVVVDDDRQVAEDVGTGLRWAGVASVDVAVTARQVQQRLLCPPIPHIVLIDFWLIGQQTGLDVALWLREQPALQYAIRVLYTSADVPVIQRLCPDDQVFHAIISKPVALPSLIEQLARLVPPR
jgi:CheY-like chemotaxis protein